MEEVLLPPTLPLPLPLQLRLPSLSPSPLLSMVILQETQGFVYQNQSLLK